jgi:hypothetical protein
MSRAVVPQQEWQDRVVWGLVVPTFGGDTQTDLASLQSASSSHGHFGMPQETTGKLERQSSSGKFE